MKPKHHNTDKLWRALLSVINLLALGSMLLFGYLLLGDTIQAYLNRPQYSKEKLKQLSKNRNTIRAHERAEDWDLVENGIHVKTGLKADENLQLVISSCTSCHSAKLITQNRATRAGWKSMIRWMQETQGLADLGSAEVRVLDYLAKHYAPEEVGRRKNLDMNEVAWYVLELGGE